MMIGLNPGPRARTVKPGPRHLRTRPDPRPEPVRSPQGHTFGGGTPVHTSRYRGCDVCLSSHSPTANQGGAECHHCGHWTLYLLFINPKLMIIILVRYTAAIFLYWKTGNTINNLCSTPCSTPTVCNYTIIITNQNACTICLPFFAYHFTSTGYVVQLQCY